MKKDEIRELLNDLENDRVERTISTTNTDKFGQATCTFANDLPNHQLAKDNSEEQGLRETTGQYTKLREPIYKLTNKVYDIYFY